MSVKIGVLGGNGNIVRAPKILLESTVNQDIEIVEVTQDQVDDDKRKLAIVGGLPISHFDGEDFRAKAMCQTWSLSGSGKTGSNKSDRKRNRKNRWR